MEIPGYELIDTLGEGSLATVYLALEDFTERELALKLVEPKICSDSNFTESFLARARLLVGLEHPNIVEVSDSGQVERGCYLAMAYIAGRTLKHRRFELTLREQLAVVKDVAGALDYAHRHGCNHGRLNPDNIMLRDRDHQVVVTDFVMGRAPITADEGFYMSPEQRRGEEGDHRSDLYSLGAVLLLLLGGRLPLKDRLTEDHEVNAETENRAVPASKISPCGLSGGLSVFQPIITRLLAANAEERYQSGAELIVALGEITEAQLEAAARDQALAFLNKGEGNTASKATLSASQAARNQEKTAPPLNTLASPAAANRESLAEPIQSIKIEEWADKDGGQENLAQTGAFLSDAESPAGVLRVWEQDRIDNPFESEPSSRWLLASCGLAALLLVGGVLLAAVLD